MTKRFGWIAGVLTLLLVVASCEETTTPDPAPTAPNAPTELMANSTNATTVTLKWVKAATGQAPTGYIIYYTEAGTTDTRTLEVSGGNTTTAPVSALTEGKIYQFYVRAVNDTAKSAASPAVSWAPAKRFTGTFKLYGSSNSTFGSGLSLREGRVVKIDEADKWEFCFDDKDGRPLVGSPGVSGYTPPGSMEFPIVSIDSVGTSQYVRANSLDEVFDVRALDMPVGKYTEILENLAGFSNPNTGVVFFLRSRVGTTSTVNFAKILVKPNSTGTGFVNGTGADAYVEVEASFQTVSNVPYAEIERLFGGVRGAKGVQ